MSNTSKIPAYVLEAQKKGETIVPVIRRRYKAATTGETWDEPFQIKTAQAIKIFQKDFNKRTEHEKKIYPVGTKPIEQKPINAKEIASTLSAEDLRILLAEKEGESATTEEKPKRGRKPAQVSDVDDLTADSLKEKTEPQTEE